MPIININTNIKKKVIKLNSITCLGAKNHSTFFKKQSEITGKVKAPSNPHPLRNVQLGPTFVTETLHVPHRLPKRFGVGRFPVANSAKLRYRHRHLPPRQSHVSEKPGTAPRVNGHVVITGSGRPGDEPYRENGFARELEKENREESEEEKKRSRT